MHQEKLHNKFILIFMKLKIIILLLQDIEVVGNLQFYFMNVSNFVKVLFGE